jgi:hypothetical protein
VDREVGEDEKLERGLGTLLRLTLLLPFVHRWEISLVSPRGADHLRPDDTVAPSASSESAVEVRYQA